MFISHEKKEGLVEKLNMIDTVIGHHGGMVISTVSDGETRAKLIRVESAMKEAKDRLMDVRAVIANEYSYRFQLH